MPQLCFVVIYAAVSSVSLRICWIVHYLV